MYDICSGGTSLPLLLPLRSTSKPIFHSIFTTMALDHFKFYRARETDSDLSVNINVELQGQFENNFRPAVLSELVMFGAAVDKREEGIIDDDNHLTWYDFMQDTPEPIRDLTISNQFFANSNMRIAQGVGLLVPAHKLDPGNHEAPQGLDHYKLYRVVQGEQPANVAVSLKDQFVDEPSVQIGPPLLFGVPVAKRLNGNVEPIINAQDHLVLYRLPPAPNNIPVRSRDQFGEFAFNIRRRKFLAVPTLKLTVNGDPV